MGGKVLQRQFLATGIDPFVWTASTTQLHWKDLQTIGSSRHHESSATVSRAFSAERLVNDCSITFHR